MLCQNFDFGLGREQRRQMRREVEHNRLAVPLVSRGAAVVMTLLR